MNNYTRTEIILLLKPLFNKEGFKKLRSNWFKTTEDLIFVFNIQASLYGPEYYINMGIYIKALGIEEQPPEYRCHIRSRLSNIDSAKSYEEIFCKALEWFNTHNTIDKLKRLNNQNQLLFVPILTKEYLSSLNNMS